MNNFNQQSYFAPVNGIRSTNKMMMDSTDGRATHMSNPGLPMR